MKTNRKEYETDRQRQSQGKRDKETDRKGQ